MIKSIVVTALRNILRHRSFSLINLIGLAVSMSLGLLIIMIVQEQYTFDNFHQDADRIYRVNTMALRVDGGEEPYASTPLPMARAIRDDYSFAEKVVAINRRFNGDAVYGNVNVPVTGLFADPSFLDVFNFPLEKGNPATALNDPNSLILTQEAATKIFGKHDPIGQTVSMQGFGDFKVTGVLKPFPSKTHFEFEVLGSTVALPGLEKQGIIRSTVDDWNNYYGSYVYFKLAPGHTTEEASQALAQIYKDHYTGVALETRDRGYEFYLHPLTEITPGPELSNQMGNGLPDIILIFLSVLAGIVMVMACFNYTNLMIAKSLSRAREIGVRKVVGAQRWQVFAQFVGESVIFSLVSLVFSYLFLQILKPGFMQLHITQEFSVDLNEDMRLYAIFVAFAIGVGIIAGILPAIYLSAFRASRVLKDISSLRIYSRLTFRRVLMVIQFTLSLVFIIVVMVIYRQINYMVTSDYGINDKNIVNVRLQGLDYEKLANEVRLLPGVVRVGGVSHALGTWADRSSDYKKSQGDKPFVMRDFMVDDAYIKNLEIEFLAGKNFDPQTEGRQETHVILNETALKQFDLSDPVSAIGEDIFVNDSVQLQVIGVVKDFHFRPLNYQIGPIALRYSPRDFGYLSALINPVEKDKTVAALESIWKKLDAVHPFEWAMMDDQIDQAYEDAGFSDMVTIVGYISFLAVCIACLGMLGMAMYSTQTRVKEIGVRKVMGANVPDIVLLLSRSFLVLIGAAVVVAVPVSMFLGQQFLDMYAYKITITPLLLLSGVLIVLVLGMLTICSQTIRAAVTNPVKSLRYE